jgi:ligand-binding sensor domain-containing protein
LFSTARGVCVYKEGKIIQSIPIVNDAQNDWKKTATDFWFNAGNTEGVYRYDGQQLNYLAFPNPKVINPNNVYFVTCLSEGKNNWIWIGTYAGVFGYNGEQFTIINDDNLKLINESGALHIRSILEDSKGRLWIGNNGIGVLLKEGDELINFSEKHKLIHPSSSRSGGPSMAGTLEHVFAIEEDKDGNIWFADRDTGIWKYDGQSISNFTTEKGLSNYFAFAIYKDKRDDLWFGLEDGQIFKLNGELFERQF